MGIHDKTLTEIIDAAERATALEAERDAAIARAEQADAALIAAIGRDGTLPKSIAELEGNVASLAFRLKEEVERRERVEIEAGRLQDALEQAYNLLGAFHRDAGALLGCVDGDAAPAPVAKPKQAASAPAPKAKAAPIAKPATGDAPAFTDALDAALWQAFHDAPAGEFQGVIALARLARAHGWDGADNTVRNRMVRDGLASAWAEWIETRAAPLGWKLKQTAPIEPVEGEDEPTVEKLARQYIARAPGGLASHSEIRSVIFKREGWRPSDAMLAAAITKLLSAGEIDESKRGGQPVYSMAVAAPVIEEVAPVAGSLEGRILDVLGRSTSARNEQVLAGLLDNPAKRVLRATLTDMRKRGVLYRRDDGMRGIFWGLRPLIEQGPRQPVAGETRSYLGVEAHVLNALNAERQTFDAIWKAADRESPIGLFPDSVRGVLRKLVTDGKAVKEPGAGFAYWRLADAVAEPAITEIERKVLHVMRKQSTASGGNWTILVLKRRTGEQITHKMMDGLKSRGLVEDADTGLNVSHHAWKLTGRKLPVSDPETVEEAAPVIEQAVRGTEPVTFPIGSLEAAAIHTMATYDAPHDDDFWTPENVARKSGSAVTRTVLENLETAGVLEQSAPKLGRKRKWRLIEGTGHHWRDKPRPLVAVAVPSPTTTLPGDMRAAIERVLGTKIGTDFKPVEEAAPVPIRDEDERAVEKVARFSDGFELRGSTKLMVARRWYGEPFPNGGRSQGMGWGFSREGAENTMSAEIGRYFKKGGKALLFSEIVEAVPVEDVAPVEQAPVAKPITDAERRWLVGLSETKPRSYDEWAAELGRQHGGTFDAFSLQSTRQRLEKRGFMERVTGLTGLGRAPHFIRTVSL